MKNREEFIKLLSEQIRCKRAREDVIREIEAHISDQAQEYEAEGMEPEKAMEEAVEQMGDPVAVGVELDRIHRPRMDWGMVAMAVLFSLGGLAVQCGIGLMAVGSAAFERQCLFIGIGFCLMLGICFLDYSFIGKYAKPLYLLFAAGIVFYIAQFSDMVNGMHRGMILPMYLFAPLYAGILYQYRKTGYAGLLKSIAFLLIPLWIAWRGIPSVVTAFCLFVICGGMLVMVVAKGWFSENRKQTLLFLLLVGILLPVAGIAAGYVFWLADYQKMRVLAFLAPEAYSDGAGYIYRIIGETLNHADWVGGSEYAKTMWEGGLPEEFILLGLVSFYGIAVGFLAVFALAALVIYAFLISLNQKNQLGLMVGMGCTLILGVQVVLGTAVNFGCLPDTIVVLPFLTGGGSVTVTYSIFIGLLLSVSRNRDVLSDRLYRPGWQGRIMRVESLKKMKD
ncbi:MAG TPA: FtsW/RodA/SpoVE family cell cycle protein [Candidatus Eisenbergiella merdipullorum]|uniref:FtsW/RodA/SpoVE family cell cycle protein n=1 Tax=Candidatus Eisenbergiella merdipullorum TaxID=2838553 RepID=A0A9D2L032_9FIRM|nr:FtsW/RodA/SpoVE family cell cycle protein [Candidatus Eisenbergiella merdipullorum]